MPRGWDNAIVGIAGFAAVKFAGYTALARLINVTHELTKPPALSVGIVRTVVGICIGIVYGRGAAALGFGSSGESAFLFCAGLVPVRLAEWALVLFLFYPAASAVRKNLWSWLIRGTICSYILDVPAAIGALATGGIWIC